jgi:hypothetical protein
VETGVSRHVGMANNLAPVIETRAGFAVNCSVFASAAESSGTAKLLITK